MVEYGVTEPLGTSAEAIVDKDGVCRVVLNDLDPRTLYLYRIRGGTEDLPKVTPIYELNTALNFSPPALGSKVPGNGSSETAAAEVLRRTGLRKGIAIIPHSFDADFAVDLAGRSDLAVVGFEASRERVERLRADLYKEKIYGARISVMQTASTGEWPIASGVADLVICDEWPQGSPAAEATRVLAPGRGVLCVMTVTQDVVEILRAAGLEVAVDDWLIARRPASVDAGRWTHQYGDTGNTATSGEALGGARATGDMKVQWFGRPGADFGLDRQSRMPAPLAANGRLFHQGMNRLVALNAHNGAVLWGMEIPDLQRLNMPRDASNWCVDDENLYVVVKDQAWVIDAETGQRRDVLAIPDLDLRLEEAQDERCDWGYIGRSGDYLVGTATRPGSTYRGFWTSKMWFDGRGGSYGTAQVCSDAIFGCRVSGGGTDPWTVRSESRHTFWSRQSGMILNPTIAMHDGRILFVECRNKDLHEDSKNSQIADERLWSDQFLVALDLESGELVWERPIDTEDGTVTFYLQATSDAILITASNTEYHLYAFSPDDGEPMWQRSNPWPNDHHSGHIQHPVILDGTIYLQPNGYDLLSGEIVTTRVGSRSGCHTYIGARDALIFRGTGRQVAMWDREKETVTAWSRLRPSCWLSLIPANGMLLVPEGGGGCSCGGWMETSIGFSPMTGIQSRAGVGQ